MKRSEVLAQPYPCALLLSKKQAITQLLRKNHEVEASLKKQQYEQQEVQDSDNYSPNVSVDYWSWKADDEEVKKEEEKVDDVVVAPHVHDATHPNHAYWDFPSQVGGPEEMRKKLIDKILNEERIRDVLSSASVTEREINFHRVRQQQQTKYESAAAGRDISAPKSMSSAVPADYWDFSSEECFLSLVTCERQQLIDKILREEKHRYLLSTENIERNLNAQKNVAGPEHHYQSQSNSLPAASYWEWKACDICVY